MDDVSPQLPAQLPQLRLIEIFYVHREVDSVLRRQASRASGATIIGLLPCSLPDDILERDRAGNGQESVSEHAAC